MWAGEGPSLSWKFELRKRQWVTLTLASLASQFKHWVSVPNNTRVRLNFYNPWKFKPRSIRCLCWKPLEIRYLKRHAWQLSWRYDGPGEIFSWLVKGRMKKAWGFVVRLNGETEGMYVPLYLGHVCGHPSCLQLEEEAGAGGAETLERGWLWRRCHLWFLAGGRWGAGTAPWPSRAAACFGGAPLVSHFISVSSGCAAKQKYHTVCKRRRSAQFLPREIVTFRAEIGMSELEKGREVTVSGVP